MDKKMILTAHEQGASCYVPLTWVSAEKDEAGQPLQIRNPVPSKKTYPLPTGFLAGGQPYLSIKQLQAEKTQTDGLFLDIYGREVLCLKERFPCFDSYDYLYEHRYYRWFFLRCDDKLVQVYYEDERKTLDVTEDVDRVRSWMWKDMQDVWKLE